MIIFNKALHQNKLESFLKSQFPEKEIYLFYETDIDWDMMGPNILLFKYEQDTGLNAGFCFYLSDCFVPDKQYCSTVEKLSSALALHFDCSVACDASRLQLTDYAYYSLLFENNRVYLADDFRHGENGCGDIDKEIELSYDWPDYAITDYVATEAVSTVRLNKALEFHALQLFLERQFPNHEIQLYRACCALDELPEKTLCFSFFYDSTLSGGDFLYGLNLHFDALGEPQNMQKTTEKLSAALSLYFDCASVCCALRLLIPEGGNTHCKILFENERVYWVTDEHLYRTGYIQRFIALNYALPD